MVALFQSVNSALFRNVSDKIPADSWPRVKYEIRSIQSHASFRLVEVIRNFCARYFLVVTGLSILRSSGTDGLDWRVHDYCRRTRLYWTLFGRGYPFFKGQELAKLKAPQFDIEFDIDDHDQYTPQLIVGFYKLNPKARKNIPIERRFIKVAVRNRGIAVARRTKATLQLVSSPKGAIVPSSEPKELRWETGETRQDIGAVNGLELLHIVLSDSRVGTITQNHFAYIATPNTLNELGHFRNQDGIGLGSFVFHLVVTETKTGHQWDAHYKVTVSKNWRKLTMARVF